MSRLCRGLHSSQRVEGGSLLPVGMKSLVPYLAFSDTPVERTPLTSLTIAWPDEV